MPAKFIRQMNRPVAKRKESRKRMRDSVYYAGASGSNHTVNVMDLPGIEPPVCIYF